jgi:hypothetical protein
VFHGSRSVNTLAVSVGSFHGEGVFSDSSQFESSSHSVSIKLLGLNFRWGVVLIYFFFYNRGNNASDNTVLGLVRSQGPGDGDGCLIVFCRANSQIIDRVGWACEETAVFSPWLVC